MANLLKNAFPHLNDNQIKITVQGMFTLNQDVSAFKEHIRDFLVQIRVSEHQKTIFSNLFHQKYILKLLFLFSRNSPEKTTPTCISTRGKLRLRLLKAKNAVSKCLYPEYLILTRFQKKCKTNTNYT